MPSGTLNGYRIAAYARHVIWTEHSHYGRQVWGLARLTERHRRDHCELCGRIVGARAFRPVTNLENRMKRICARHMPNPCAFDENQMVRAKSKGKTTSVKRKRAKSHAKQAKSFENAPNHQITKAP